MVTNIIVPCRGYWKFYFYFYFFDFSKFILLTYGWFILWKYSCFLVVLISAIEQSDSITYILMFFFILFSNFTLRPCTCASGEKEGGNCYVNSSFKERLRTVHPQLFWQSNVHIFPQATSREQKSTRFRPEILSFVKDTMIKQYCHRKSCIVVWLT